MSEISEELAWLYHAHHRRHGEDLPFWRTELERQGAPPLELGCGTGRVLLHLAGSGRPVYGLDKSKSMLKVLQENTSKPKRGLIRIIQADLTAFRLNCQFPLIILPCNTYSTLPLAARRATLQRVSEHLASGGNFAASLPNPKHLRSLPTQGDREVEEIFSHPFDRRPVQVSSSWQRTSEQFIMQYDYDHLYDDGRVDRLSIRSCHHMTPLEELMKEFEEAGLSIDHIYGGYDRSFYNDSSLVVIITATKR